MADHINLCQWTLKNESWVWTEGALQWLLKLHTLTEHTRSLLNVSEKGVALTAVSKQELNSCHFSDSPLKNGILSFGSWEAKCDHGTAHYTTDDLCGRRMDHQLHDPCQLELAMDWLTDVVLRYPQRWTVWGCSLDGKFFSVPPRGRVLLLLSASLESTLCCTLPIVFFWVLTAADCWTNFSQEAKVCFEDVGNEQYHRRKKCLQVHLRKHCVF